MTIRDEAARLALSYVRLTMPRDIHRLIADAARLYGTGVVEFYRLICCWVAHRQTPATLAQMMRDEVEAGRASAEVVE